MALAFFHYSSLIWCNLHGEGYIIDLEIRLLTNLLYEMWIFKAFESD